MTNSVTFPISLGGDGSTTTDDSNATTGLGAGGHRTRLLPVFSQGVIMAQTSVTQAAAALASATAAAASAASAVSSPASSSTSTTSLTIGTGTQSLTIQTGKTMPVGSFQLISRTSDSTKWMIGTVTSYNTSTGALVVSVPTNYTNGSGTFTDWTISLTAARGIDGDILNGVTLSSIGASLKPSFLVDFANTGSYDLRLSFTRATAGGRYNNLGLYESVPAGVPRIDYDPATGECLGLLIEEGRTNLSTYSEQIDNAAWTKAACTITVNSLPSPDGNTTADTLTATVGTATRSVLQSFTGTAGIYTISIYAKAGTTNWLALSFATTAQSNGAFFNLTTGVVGTVAAGVSATIQNIGNGWYRCSITKTLTAATYYHIIEVHSADNQTQSWTASGTEVIYLWGAQSELGTLGGFVTSYIPTTSSTVTRNADLVFTTALTPWYNATEGTIFSTFTYNIAAASTVIFGVNDGTSSNCIRFAAPDLTAQVTAGGVNTFATTYLGITNTYHKAALAYALNNSTSSLDGSSGTVDTSVTVPSGISRLDIGSFVGGSQINGHIKKFAYYPKRIADAELTAITTL